MIGGVAFGVAGLLDSTLGGSGTDPWVIAVHLAVSTSAALTLTWFVRNAWRSDQAAATPTSEPIP